MNKNQVRYGAMLSYILIALNALSGFFLSPFILRCLGESEFGVYKAVASMTATISVMEMGLGGTMQRYIAQFVARKDRESANNFSAMGMAESGILNIAILIVGTVLYTTLDRVFGGKFTATELAHAKQIYWILLLNVVCHLFENTLFGIIAGYNQFIFTNSLKIGLLALKVLLYLVFLPLAKSAMLLVTLIFILECITVLCEILYLYIKLGHRIRLTKWDNAVFKESFIYAMALFVQTLVIQFNGNIDNVVIGAVIGTGAVTVYSFAIQIFNMYENCATAISGVMLPTVMHQLQGGASDRELEETIIKTGRIQWMVLGAILVGFFCCGKEFFSLWLGAGFEDCWLLSLILLLPVTIHLITNVGLSVLRARNLMTFRTVYLLCSALLNFLITVLGVPKFGYWAAVAGTAAAALFGDVVALNLYYSKKLHFRVIQIYQSVLHKTTICLLLCGAVILLLNPLFGGSWLCLAVKILIFLVLYLLLLIFFGFNKEEKEVFFRPKMRDDPDFQKCHAIMEYIYAALFGKEISERTKQADAAELYTISRKNAVAGVVYNGIRKSGTVIEETVTAGYNKEADKGLFVYAMQSQQLATLSKLFQKEKIPFLVLKGSRMRDLYPSPELRTSTDIDILVQGEDDRLIQLMKSLGYTYEKDSGTTLNFRFGAAIEVELHRHLFDDALSFHGYFDSIWDRVQLKDGWKYQYVMSEEDFFANMIAHFAKHFSRYGCGIRNAVDIAVYLKNAPKSFDLDRAETILKKIGLYPFEQRVLQLIHSWETDKWTEEEIALTSYILGCGLFGTKKSTAAHSLLASKNKHARQKKLFSHIFPSYEIMSRLYPALKKCPILLPLCWIARGFRLLFMGRDRIRSTLKLYSQVDEATLEETKGIMQLMHLENVN